MIMHYLKVCVALGPDKAKASGRAVIDKMKATPTDDPLFGKGGRCAGMGRVIHDMHLFEVKSPLSSQKARGTTTSLASPPAADAFRPIDKGGCSFTGF